MAGFSDLHEQQQERLYLKALEKAADHCRENHNEWQSIETAPKDGKPILGVTETCYAVIEHYGIDEDGDDRWLEAGEYRFFPTHWKPLDPPPTNED